MIYEWPVYSPIYFVLSFVLIAGLIAALAIYVYIKGRKNRIWLSFVNQSLQRGLNYVEIESLKRLYGELYALGKGKVILDVHELRRYLASYFLKTSHEQSACRRDVQIFRRLGFAKHTEELLERKEIDLGEAVSIEIPHSTVAMVGLVTKVHEDAVELLVRNRFNSDFKPPALVLLYFYRPASGGVLLTAKVESIVDRKMLLKTNYQFAHAEERHFMADIEMPASLCINMVPLIQLRNIEEGQQQDGDLKGDSAKELIKWRKLDPKLGQFDVKTVRLSDRGVVVYHDSSQIDTKEISKNYLNRTYTITIDFIDGGQLQAIGHLMSMGRRDFYLFRFAGLLPEERDRIVYAVKKNNPQKERLV